MAIRYVAEVSIMVQIALVLNWAEGKRGVQLNEILPQSDPVRKLYQEDIHGFVGSEKLVEVVTNVEAAILIVCVSGLRPYQVGRGTGHKFPADNQVG